MFVDRSRRGAHACRFKKRGNGTAVDVQSGSCSRAPPPCGRRPSWAVRGPRGSVTKKKNRIENHCPLSSIRPRGGSLLHDHRVFLCVCVYRTARQHSRAHSLFPFFLIFLHDCPLFPLVFGLCFCLFFFSGVCVSFPLALSHPSGHPKTHKRPQATAEPKRGFFFRKEKREACSDWGTPSASRMSGLPLGIDRDVVACLFRFVSCSGQPKKPKRKEPPTTASAHATPRAHVRGKKKIGLKEKRGKNLLIRVSGGGRQGHRDDHAQDKDGDDE